jgi:DNA-3-methyladenine glycosylase
MILPRSFYLQDTRDVAEQLLGKLLVRKVGKQRISGIIVETEAYRGFRDTASHAHKGPTKRCEVMFGEGGFSYVYLTYGIHEMFNVVTEKKDFPSAVLIRAVEPFEGVELIKKLRGVKRDRDLTSGPGKLTRALKIDRSLNGCDLVKRGYIWIEELNKKWPDGQMAKWLDGFRIQKTPRIGIDYADKKARNWKWRFFVEGNEYVSR